MKSIEFTVIEDTYIDPMPLLHQYQQQEEFPEKKYIYTHLKKKLDGYKAQDKRWEIYSEYHTIKMDELLNQLIESNMKCHYCRKSMKIKYRNRDPLQWTLDRIQNEQGHNKMNVVISCLGCNLSRRNIHIDKFLFTKQLIIEKIDEIDEKI